MSISILVLDDSRPIAEGFGSKLRRYSDQHFRIGLDVEVLCSSDDAVRRISDESRPSFDLLFTDIDLAGGDVPDKAGVAFARYARTRLPGVPVIGYSGRFDEDDLSEADRSLFDRWWAKGGSSFRLDEMSEDALQRAISFHQAHRRKLAQDSECHPTPTCGHPDSVLVTPKTNEEFLARGYAKSFVEPSQANGLEEPFAIWVKTSEEGVEIEVVGCSALFSWGDSYEDAEAGLFEVIAEIQETLNEPDETFSQSLLNAKRFVQTVTGKRTAEGGK